MHSTTKYCGGHSDVVGGALVTSRTPGVAAYADLDERIGFHQNAIGGVAGPFDAWLVLRGLQDPGRPDGPALRQRRAGRGLPRPSTRGSRQVLYPGRADHPGHEVAARQMKRFGGMVSFRVRGGVEEALGRLQAGRGLHAR